jgi:endoglycosylceramidase
VNVVVKEPPWIPVDSSYTFTDKDMATLQELGLNALRLGMMWPGVEPERGKYNFTYLEVARNLTKQAASYGIFTLLDMHQDGYNAKLCGEGLPDWSVRTGNAGAFPFPFDKDPYPINPSTGYPYPKDCGKFFWATYYWSEAVSAAFQMLYNNTDGIQDSFADFWSTVAKYFKDDEEILGYELINEPWAGDVYGNPGLLLPTIADRQNFQPMYDRVNHAIRSVDEQHCIYFESITWDELTNGFEHVPGGDSYRNRSVVSYHFYIPPDISVEASMQGHMDDLKRLKCGGFLTEFGIRSVSDLLFEELDILDKLLQSWTGWDYKPYYGITGDGSSIWLSNGSLNMPLVMVLSRTYAQAVAGVTKQMYYNNRTHEFTLSYEVQDNVSSQVTEIYLNTDLHYPKGYTVTITPDSAAQWEYKERRVLVTHSEHLKPGTLIRVDIKPK